MPIQHGSLRKLFSNPISGQRDRKLLAEAISPLRGGGSCSGLDCKYVPALGLLENYSVAQQNWIGFISVVVLVVTEVLLSFIA
jgi:hypothetical protein